MIGHCTKLDWIIRYEKEYHWYDFRQSRKAYTSFYNASDPDEYGAAALYDCGWGNCWPLRRCPGAGWSGCPYIDVQMFHWIYWRGCSVFIRACIMACSHALCFSSLFLLQKEIASIIRLYGTYWKRDLLSADLFFRVFTYVLGWRYDVTCRYIIFYIIVVFFMLINFGKSSSAVMVSVEFHTYYCDWWCILPLILCVIAIHFYRMYFPGILYQEYVRDARTLIRRTWAICTANHPNL